MNFSQANKQGMRMRLPVLVVIAAFAVAACQEPAPQKAATTEQPNEMPQCHKDTDCKGDRICDSGACKSPSAPEVATREVPNSPQSRWRAPKFADYPVTQIYEGPPAKLVMDNDTA